MAKMLDCNFELIEILIHQAMGEIVYLTHRCMDKNIL